jgi:hypothetical protein
VHLLLLFFFVDQMGNEMSFECRLLTFEGFCFDLGCFPMGGCTCRLVVLMVWMLSSGIYWEERSAEVVMVACSG